MAGKYMYHGMDITLDVYEKLCMVIEMLAEKEKKSFDECYARFSASRAYEALQNGESLMWSESAEFILDEYYRHQPDVSV